MCFVRRNEEENNVSFGQVQTNGQRGAVDRGQGTPGRAAIYTVSPGTREWELESPALHERPASIRLRLELL